MVTEPKIIRLGAINGSVKTRIRDFLFGLFFFQLHQETLQLSEKYRNTIELLLFAEFLGLPFMSSPVTLRLLPYFIGDLEKFKENNSREHDILVEIAENDLH